MRIEARVALPTLLVLVCDARRVPAQLLEPARELLAKLALGGVLAVVAARYMPRNEVSERAGFRHFDVAECLLERASAAFLEVMPYEALVWCELVREKAGSRLARAQSLAKGLDLRH